MNILLIGNLVEDRQESMQRFTTLLHTGLQERGHTVTVLAPTLQLARRGPKYRYGGLPKYLGYFDKFVLFPRRLRRWIAQMRPDVVHITDHANAVYGSALGGLPGLATCHDLLQVRAARGEIPQQKVGPAGRFYQARILTALARLPHVACVSHQTRADVLRLTGLPAPQVTVVPNALNQPFQQLPVATARARLNRLATVRGFDPALFGAPRGGFLLHVGGAQWYKNRSGLLAIHAGLGRLLSPAPALIIVGPPLSAELVAQVSAQGRGAPILCLTSVSGPELEALYNLAAALIFPSWEEGFGWPLAEAQACGCPVFATNRAPMTEVGGRSSVYFDPADIAGAARIIAGAWAGRDSLRPLALKEAQRWQPAAMLDAYEQLYRQIVP
jgi:glycosyltransferase involved in cell wall biosynthesis